MELLNDLSAEVGVVRDITLSFESDDSVMIYPIMEGRFDRWGRFISQASKDHFSECVHFCCFSNFLG